MHTEKANFFVQPSSSSSNGEGSAQQRQHKGLEQDEQEGQQKNNQGDAVHAVHVLHPRGAGRIGIGFAQKKVFSHLFPDAHVNGLRKDNKLASKWFLPQTH